MTAPKNQDYNDLAIASLVLGILSLTGMGPLTGIPAIITGWMGLKKPINKGMAIAGIITGSIATLFTILIVGFFVLLLALGMFAAGELDSSELPDNTRSPFDSSFFQQQT